MYQRGAGIFIMGESGQGKTRLLQEFTSHLNPSPRLLLAQCRPMEINLPFQPVIDLLRQQISPKEWLALPAVWAEQLQILFPELNRLRSDLRHHPVTAQEQNRAQLLEGVHQLFMILGKNQRLLMILDDAQWADEATLAVLSYLLERPPFRKDACLIVAARQEEENPNLDSMLSQAKRSNDIRVLHLSQLELNEIDDLVQQVMGAPADPRFVLKLSQDTGGNPFFILETLHAIIKQQYQPDLESLMAQPLSTSVYNLIRQRVQVLTPAAQTLLEFAAIFGREFTTNALIRASGFSDDVVVASIDELEERLLITRQEPNDRGPQYRFVHDKFREAFLLDLSPIRAQIIHRKIAFALSSEADTPSGSQAAVLASHFEAAGEWYLAYLQWIKAGQHAHRLYAVTEAAQAFKNAEKLIERSLNQLNDKQIYDLYRAWGEIAYAANDAPALHAMNINLMRLGDELQSPLLRGTAYVRLGNACFSSGKLEEGLEFTRFAIQELSKTNHTYQLIDAKINYGVFLYMASYGSQAIQVFEEALLFLDNDPNRDNLYLRASLQYEMGFSQIMCGQPLKGRDYGLQSLKNYQLIDNLDGTSAALADLTLAEYFLGNYSQAFQYNQRGLENAQQAHSWRMLGYHANYRAMLDFASGNLDGMLEYAENAIGLGHRIGRTDIASISNRLIADAFYMLREYQKSLDYLQIAYDNGKNSLLAIDAQYRMQASQFIIDQKEEHISELKKIIGQIEVGGMVTGILHAQMSLAMAYHILQKWQEVGSLALEIKNTALARGFRSFVCGANMILSQSEWHLENHSQAFSLLQESIREAESIPHVWLELSGRMLLNQYLQQDGKPLGVNRNRLDQLLKFIEDHCHQEIFQPALQSYLSLIRQSLF
jgi:tetratricopeptide (TPR) repeat protein